MRVSEVTRNVVVVLGGDSRPVRRTISTVGRGAMALAPMASSSKLRSMAAANARRVRMVSACWWCGVGGRAADAAASLGEMLRWAVAVIAMASGAMAEFVGVGKGGGWIVRSAMRSMGCVVVAAGSVSAEAGAAAAAAALGAVAMASRWVMSLCGSERGGAAMEEAVAVVSEMVEEHPAAFVRE